MTTNTVKAPAFFTPVPNGTKVGDTITSPEGNRCPNLIERVEHATILDDDNFYDDVVRDLLATWTDRNDPWVLARVKENQDSATVLEILTTPRQLTAELFGPQTPQLAALAKKFLEISDNLDEDFPGYDSWEIDDLETPMRAAEQALSETELDTQWRQLGNCQWGHEFLSLAARHLIREGTAWDQAAYDEMTMGFRVHIGQLHPDDVTPSTHAKS